MTIMNLRRAMLPVMMALALLPAAAQTRHVEVKPGPFVGVSVSGDFELSLVRGKDYAVAMDVSEEFAEFLSTEVVDSVLVIGVDDKKDLNDIWKSFRGKNNPAPIFRATVTCPAVLSSIAISGDTQLKELGAVCNTSAVQLSLKDNASAGTSSVRSSSVELNLNKKSSGEFRLNCDSLKVNAGGSTEFTLRCTGTSKVGMELSGNASLVFAGDAVHVSLAAKGTSRAILNGSASYAVYNLSGSANVNALNIKVKEANIAMSGICSLMQGATDWIFLNISNGANLTFSGNPQIHIANIKNSSVQRYESAGRK